MLGFGRTNTVAGQALACFLSDKGFSLVSLANDNSIQWCDNSYFPEPTEYLITNSLAEAVDKHELYGVACQIILAPNLYQLHLMDMPQLPEEEMAKALRWQLKGIIDYPLNDIAVDAFLVPAHGVGERRKKVFTAVTLQTGLMHKIAIFEQCLLKVAAVSIAELALGSLLSYVGVTKEATCIVISFDDDVCQLHLYHNENLYLLRNLLINNDIVKHFSAANHDMLLEIQRSIDYCITELKLPEPKRIVFTPNFYQATDLFEFLSDALDKEVLLMDLQTLTSSSTVARTDMVTAFYAIGGALMLAERGR